MKRIICAAAVFFLVGSTCWAQSSRSFSNYYEGKRYKFEVTEKMLDQTPVWSDAAENPPLTARRAAQIAQQNLSVFVPNATKWRLENIHLSPIGIRWVYVVEFSEPLIPEAGQELYLRTGPVTRFSIVVLMNGEVVKPSITEHKSPQTDRLKRRNIF